jgi:hypothetical protein
MDSFDSKDNMQKNEVYSKAVRIGRRTYFFDLKVAKSEEPYLTITESKRRFNQNTSEFYYEKRKIFLMKEDLPSFHAELGKVIETIDSHPEWLSDATAEE